MFRAPYWPSSDWCPSWRPKHVDVKTSYVNHLLAMCWLHISDTCDVRSTHLSCVLAECHTVWWCRHQWIFQLRPQELCGLPCANFDEHNSPPAALYAGLLYRIIIHTDGTVHVESSSRHICALWLPLSTTLIATFFVDVSFMEFNPNRTRNVGYFAHSFSYAVQ